MSYCTVEEANAYVSLYFTSSDEGRVSWDALSDSDKQVLLNQAHDIIDALPIHGRKTCVDQPDAFPRFPEKEVPTAVRHAECELAVSLSDKDTNESLNEYRRCPHRRQGAGVRPKIGHRRGTVPSPRHRLCRSGAPAADVAGATQIRQRSPRCGWDGVPPAQRCVQLGPPSGAACRTGFLSVGDYQ